MANVQHKALTPTDLHVASYWGSTDPGAVGAGIFWVDTSAGLGGYVLKVRNQPNNGWDTIVANTLSDGANEEPASSVASHIQDANVDGSKVWHHQIDDSSPVDSTLLWSSEQTSTVISAHTSTSAIHRSINDAGVGSTDLYSAQHIIALFNAICPVGIIVAWPYTNPPAGGIWLNCTGAEFAPATYPALYAVIGHTWGTAGSGNPRFPDLRGVVLRGGNYGRGLDPDVASRTALYPGGNSGDAIGSYQGDAIGGHLHPFSIRTRTFTRDTSAGGGSSELWHFDSEEARNTSANTGAGGETRMKNVCVNFIIRAQ